MYIIILHSRIAEEWFYPIDESLTEIEFNNYVKIIRSFVRWVGYFHIVEQISRCLSFCVELFTH